MPTLKVTLRNRRERAATRHDIRAIAGPLEEAIVMAILHTGATPDEVQEAHAGLEENHHTKAISVRQMEDRVRHVYNILDYAHNGFEGGSGR